MHEERCLYQANMLTYRFVYKFSLQCGQDNTNAKYVYWFRQPDFNETDHVNRLLKLEIWHRLTVTSRRKQHIRVVGSENDKGIMYTLNVLCQSMDHIKRCFKAKHDDDCVVQFVGIFTVDMRLRLTGLVEEEL